MKASVVKASIAAGLAFVVSVVAILFLGTVDTMVEAFAFASLVTVGARLVVGGVEGLIGQARYRRVRRDVVARVDRLNEQGW